jgi:hydroxymethylpyrimidine/phosphomethylpyrimidine kinase
MVAAIAANIGLGYDIEVAVERAIDYVQGAIIHSYALGKGNGPLNHLYRQRNFPFTPYSLLLILMNM